MHQDKRKTAHAIDLLFFMVVFRVAPSDSKISTVVSSHLYVPTVLQTTM